MRAIIAVGHIGGSILVLLALGAGALFLSAWAQERRRNAFLGELSLSLNIPIDALESDTSAQRVTRYLSERYSTELFRNRLSDLCGFLQIAWQWLLSIVQAAILLGVIWFSFTDSPEMAIYAWSVIVVGLLAWLIEIVFIFLCRMVTGRYPGEAWVARRNLALFINKEPPKTAPSLLGWLISKLQRS